jgi:uncharacterized protein YjbI with pentapeptide repeats
LVSDRYLVNWSDIYRTGQILTGQIFTGQIFTGQIFTGQIFTGQIFTGQIFTGQIFTGQIRCRTPTFYDEYESVVSLLGCHIHIKIDFLKFS